MLVHEPHERRSVFMIVGLGVVAAAMRRPYLLERIGDSPRLRPKVAGKAEVPERFEESKLLLSKSHRPSLNLRQPAPQAREPYCGPAHLHAH